MSNVLYPKPYLLISSSDDTDPRAYRVPMTDNELLIGRPSAEEKEEYGERFIDIEKMYHDRREARMISRHHARIVREGDNFILENIKGQFPIGIYADKIEMGQKKPLQFNAAFRIPDLMSSHFSFVLLSGERDTQISGLIVEPRINRVFVFGKSVHFSNQEYQLLRYLYAHSLTVCPYNELIKAVYGSNDGSRKRNLEVLIGAVRKKLHEHSGGFSFLHTEDGVGLCLII